VRLCKKREGHCGEERERENERVRKRKRVKEGECQRR
jgi:hypothetical protein